MSEARPWSLARRLTRIHLVTTVSFVVAIALASALFLHAAVHAELDRFVQEEAEEVEALFFERPFEARDFHEFVQDLEREHPGIHMAWRAWPKDGAEIALGSRMLLDQGLPRPAPAAGPQRGEGGLRWATRALPDGTVIGVALDGAGQLVQFERYLAVVAAFLALAVLASLVVSRAVFQRVSALLASVAREARSVRGAGDAVAVDVRGAPREIREVTQALDEMLARIRAETEAQRLFTAGLAHELRSPVQNLVGETEVALLAPRTAERYRAVLESHLEELRALGAAIDNLVAMCSRAQARRADALEEFDLAEEAAIRLRGDVRLAERSGIRLEMRARGDTHVAGDREAILRALRNLVQNAVDWTPAGGRVTVAIEGGEREVAVVVDDAGPGVPEDARARIFEPFYRGPAAAGRRVGYGLGLAIVKSAADDQGGAVAVEPSPLGGARFRLTLPREAEPSQVPAS